MISKQHLRKSAEGKRGASAAKGSKTTRNGSKKLRSSSKNAKRINYKNRYTDASTTIGSNATNVAPANDFSMKILNNFNETKEKLEAAKKCMMNPPPAEVYEEWKNGQLDSLLQLYLMFKRNYDYAKQLVKKSQTVEHSDKVIAVFVKQVITDFDRVNSAIDLQ